MHEKLMGKEEEDEDDDEISSKRKREQQCSRGIQGTKTVLWDKNLKHPTAF